MALTKVSRGLLGTSIVDNGNATAITIDSSENVGIGTTSPSEALQISSGGLLIDSNIPDAPANGTSGFIVDYFDKQTRFWSRGDATTAGGYVFKILENDGGSQSDAMVIDSSGKVGIGTSSPAQALQVNGRIRVSTDGSNGGDMAVDASGLAFSTIGSTQPILFERNNYTAESMRIDSSGNVGIGTTSILAKLHIAGSPQATTGALAFLRNGDATSSNTSFGGIHFSSSPGTDYSIGKSNVNNTTTLSFRNGNTGASYMDIDSSGNVLVGTTSTMAAGVDGIQLYQSIGQIGTARNSTGGANHHVFFNPNGLVGAISTSGSSTVYGTSSDQRLKENIQDAEDAGSKIDAIQVRQYDWKADGSHQDYGTIAQELVEVAPEAVSGDADSEEMMGVDYSKLVPMLIKEIQSLRNRVAQLEE